MIKKITPEVSHLRSHIGYHLRVVSNAVSQSFAQKLAACNVTVAEWVILREIYSENKTISPNVVAELTGLTRGAVSKLIDRLLRKELVTRATAADRRYQEIELTPKAMKLVPKLASIADENDESFFSALTDTERKNLTKTLTKITQLHKLNKTPIE